MAALVSTQSCCASPRDVGCVIVSEDGRCLSTGWNGVPAKIPHPKVCKRVELGMKSGEQPHLCGCQHAESNAKANAARHGIAINKCVAFVTTSPCVDCLGKLINCGITHVYYAEEYATIEEVKDLAVRAGIGMTLCENT